MSLSLFSLLPRGLVSPRFFFLCSKEQMDAKGEIVHKFVVPDRLNKAPSGPNAEGLRGCPLLLPTFWEQTGGSRLVSHEQTHCHCPMKFPLLFALMSAAGLS